MSDWTAIINGAFPVKNSVVRKQMAIEDRCPECGGHLDTGWECNDCEFDAMPLLPESFLKDGRP